MQARPETLTQVLEGLWAVGNFAGAIISVPLKAVVATRCHTLTPSAAKAGVVNVIRRTAAGWTGGSFDGAGLVAALRSSGHEPSGRTCLVVGAGGAGTAIALALLECGAASVAVRDIHDGRASALVMKLAVHFGSRIVEAAARGEFDILINATPMGMTSDDTIPMTVDELVSSRVVAEIVMEPKHTPLLVAASQLGKAVVEGERTLEGQIDALWQFLELPSV